jgi:apolipoprotein D and lipocalin family protein
MRTNRLQFICNILKHFLLPAAALLLAGCTGIPDGITPVNDFKVDRYLGTWYEIARLDHSFEQGLFDVSATYQARSDGGIDVLNRGYDPAKKAWREAKGIAYFLGPPNTASLKVVSSARSTADTT